MSTGTKWTAKELATLRANAGRPLAEIAAKIPTRSIGAVERMRRDLKLVPRPQPPAPATEAEKDLLRANCEVPCRRLLPIFPGRSEGWLLRLRIDLGLGTASKPSKPNWLEKAAATRANNIRQATEANRVKSQAKQLEPEGTAYRTASGLPARIINRFPMPDVPSVYGP